ncbi:MAG: hypothetical protein FRX49_13193 [Trebouxia sp. A1-2]|nr:MAG: hypothetical protein FRX49_13193 [Trebouxia sp. A1-2]
MHYLVDGSFAKQCIRRAQAQADLRRRFQLRFQLLAELLHVGQNALVRMGHRMKQNWKGKNRKARSDKAKAAGNHGKGNTAIQGTGCQDNATGPHPSGNLNIHYHKVMQQEWKADRQSKSRDRMQAVEVGQTLSVLSCRHYQPLKPDRAM